MCDVVHIDTDELAGDNASRGFCLVAQRRVHESEWLELGCDGHRERKVPGDRKAGGRQYRSGRSTAAALW